ncbi:MAG: SCO family protein [Acidobacteria bacterium]|nr:SCO family protein [Acidobacteriota bacterium]
MILKTFMIVILVGLPVLGQSDPPASMVGVDEQLGQTIPADIVLYDEEGKVVEFGDLLGKPSVLTLVYYRCPGICSPMLSSLLEVLEQTSLKPMEEYQVLTVSFDPTETPDVAKQKKGNYFRGFSRPFPEKGWRFLTTTPESAERLTKTVGFRYKRQGKEFIHPGVLIVLSPDGQITRYLNYDGVRFLPLDFKLSLIEAADGKIGPTINRVLRFCFSYDPEGKTYVFNLLQVTGILTMLFIIGFVGWLVVTSKNRRKEN